VPRRRHPPSPGKTSTVSWRNSRRGGRTGRSTSPRHPGGEVRENGTGEGPDRPVENRRRDRTDPAGDGDLQDRDLPGFAQGSELRGGSLAGPVPVGAGRGPGRAAEKRSEVDKALKRLGSWKEAFGKTAFSYAPLIVSETEKLRSGPLSKEEEGSVRSRVAAYQERQNLWGQVVQALNQVERVATRWKEDLEYRMEHASTAARARETGRSLLSVFGTLWNTELYVAEETTVIEGQKIVRPFSVTVGKVGKALIVLLAGLWGAGGLGTC